MKGMHVAAAAAMVVASMAMPAANDFGAWKNSVGKSYGTKVEESRRTLIFKANVAMINKHNEEAEAGKHTYTLGLGPFTDLTFDEWKATYLANDFAQYANYTKNIVVLPEVVQLHGRAGADSVDWRTSGAVTPVKNQGQCGSCWSFSTTGSTEGANKIAGNELISLSEQQLMDCSKAEGNKGCQGGAMDNAFTYIKKNGGLDSEEDYAYAGKNGQCDTEKEAKHMATISGFKDVTPESETQLLAAVTQQPVSIAIEADKPAFQHYKTGVFTSDTCGTKLDHGVLVVGYGTDGQDYWIVKNSWGAVWGDQGYIKIERDGSKKGLCGINMQPSYPTATKGPPPGPSPGPSPPAPGGECAVTPAERHRCGFLLSKSACETKGCCFDDTHPFADHCFHPKYGPGPSPPPPPGPTPPSPPPSPPSPGGGHYGDPLSGPCKSDEKEVTITGVKGPFCSPTCSTSSPCPTDVPTGTTAQPECVLEASGSTEPSNCALICRVADLGLSGTAGGCPENASCKQVQSSALCTYDK